MRKRPWIWTVWLSCVLLGGMLRAEGGARLRRTSRCWRAPGRSLGPGGTDRLRRPTGLRRSPLVCQYRLFLRRRKQEGVSRERPAGCRQALPARHPQPARHRAVRRSRRLHPRPGSPLRCPEGRVLLPAGRTRQLSPLRDQPRRNGTAATDVRAVTTITSRLTCPTAASCLCQHVVSAG